MEDFGKTLSVIYKKHLGFLVSMLLLLLLSIGLLVVSLLNLNPSGALVSTGYGDIGGYRNGSWSELIVFPILAVVLGILHNIIAVQIFKKRGVGLASIVVAASILLVIGAFVIFFRLLGEG